MILDRFVVHNFGPYFGRQEFVLSPESADRPVILVGGLNGNGKTTLLDALKLVLFGKLAKCSSRNQVPYPRFLAECIHKRVSPEEGASVELEFRHTSHGETHRYRVCRWWSASGNGSRERLEVSVDGQLDVALTENWLEAIESIFPLRVSHLFLFDGEQIEGYARPETSTQLLRTAVHSMLGLDLVAQLDADLRALERRKTRSTNSAFDEEEVRRLEGEIEVFVGRREQLLGQRAALTNTLERSQSKLENLELKLSQQGGDLWEQRGELESRQRQASSRMVEASERLRDLAQECAPLLLVRQLLSDLAEQVATENRVNEARLLATVLAARDEELASLLRTLGVHANLLNQVKEYLSNDRSLRLEDVQSDCHLNMSRSGEERLNALLGRELGLTLEEIRRSLAEYRAASDDLDTADRLVASIPDEEFIGDLLEARLELQEKVKAFELSREKLDEELNRLNRELETANRQLSSRLERSVRSRIERSDLERFSRHTRKVRDTLTVFRKEMVLRHLTRIEQEILRSIDALLHKEALIEALRIQPDSFEMVLTGADGTEISTDRLSAGERQLFAVAMLWGLSRATRMNLPVVIDTPLGRLDSVHRANVVERYFTAASDQVLLFSTDEEIDRKLEEQLSPYISRKYILRYCDEEKATHVERGYFW